MVATPDVVWHKDSHYWETPIGGVHKLKILITEKIEEILRNFFGKEIWGVRGTGIP